jgi:Mg2+ and Co2+ transporter CorA
MNFDYMPELHHPDGYKMFWLLVLLSVILTLAFFHRGGYLRM